MLKKLILIATLFSGSVYSQCDFTSAHQILSDYHEENFKKEYSVDEIDYTFVRRIEESRDETVGHTFTYTEQFEESFEGVKECKTLSIRYNCETSIVDHEVRACLK